nr:GIY-YIG nuclease family protein [uncultured Dialister sp.]
MEYVYYVYILANEYRNVLYIGVTNNLQRRYHEHLSGTVDGFTKKYNVHCLVYYEQYNHIEEDIAREKQLKNGLAAKKSSLSDG